MNPMLASAQVAAWDARSSWLRDLLDRNSIAYPVLFTGAEEREEAAAPAGLRGCPRLLTRLRISAILTGRFESAELT